MNDTEFIELLNLYLDHEISAADAARLEAEVQTNIGRRRIYQQYCRMQKACKLAAADFQNEPVVTAASSDNKVVPFNPAAVATSRRKRATTLYTTGTFAALAACAAVVFVTRNQQNSITQPATAAPQSVAVAPASPVVTPDTASLAASQPSQPATPRGLVSVPPRPQAMWIRDPLLLTGNTQAEAMRAAALSQANNQLAWIHAVQLQPLQHRAANDFSFTSTLQPDGRALGSRTSSVKQSESAEEMVTFRFGK